MLAAKNQEPGTGTGTGTLYKYQIIILSKNKTLCPFTVRIYICVNCRAPCQILSAEASTLPLPDGRVLAQDGFLSQS